MCKSKKNTNILVNYYLLFMFNEIPSLFVNVFSFNKNYGKLNNYYWFCRTMMHEQHEQSNRHFNWWVNACFNSGLIYDVNVI